MYSLKLEQVFTGVSFDKNFVKSRFIQFNYLLTCQSVTQILHTIYKKNRVKLNKDKLATNLIYTFAIFRPCDVFAYCTNTLGNYFCSCREGYTGDGHKCTDIDECADPVLASRCVRNAECCNLPAHFVCKCQPGFEGDGEVECRGKNTKYTKKLTFFVKTKWINWGRCDLTEKNPTCYYYSETEM